MNQSSFDCIFARPLATPNNRQGTNKGKLHGRDASCAIDEHRKSVSGQGPGYIPAGDVGRAGRGAMNWGPTLK